MDTVGTMHSNAADDFFSFGSRHQVIEALELLAMQRSLHAAARHHEHSGKVLVQIRRREPVALHV